MIRVLGTRDGRLQVLYADTLVTDVPNARSNQAHRKTYPESYSDAGTDIHTKQTIVENNLPYYLLRFSPFDVCLSAYNTCKRPSCVSRARITPLW